MEDQYCAINPRNLNFQPTTTNITADQLLKQLHIGINSEIMSHNFTGAQSKALLNQLEQKQKAIERKDRALRKLLARKLAKRD